MAMPGEAAARDPNRTIKVFKDVMNVLSQPAPAPSVSEPDSRYTIEREIKAGGMGKVVLAYDRELRRQVAMKLILESDAIDLEWRTRFKNEAQIASQLDHPNILSVFDYGEDGRGNHYITMRYVPGRSLGDVLMELAAQKPDTHRAFSLRRRLEIFLKVCDAIAYAHSRHVIHRDMKPDNVLLGAYGEVLVIDWGIAKRLEDAPDDAVTTDFTDLAKQFGGGNSAPGLIMGTPTYMPPEQAAGRPELTDERSDIYSLGGLLYALLAYRSPIPSMYGENILERVKQGQIDPLDTSKAGEPIPRELRAIVLKAMAVEQKQRYSTVDTLAADVSAYLEGRDGTAFKLSPLQKAAWAVRRNPRTATAAAVLILVGLALFGFLFVRMRQALNYQTVLIGSTPPSRIEIFDANQTRVAGGDTPFTTLEPLYKGAYRIRFSQFGYAPLDKTIEVAGGVEPLRVSEKLERTAGWLVPQTDEPGVALVIRGAALKEPIRVPLPVTEPVLLESGDYTLEFSKSNLLRTETRPITIRSGQTVYLPCPLPLQDLWRIPTDGEPLFAPVVADFDGDGALDIAVAFGGPRAVLRAYDGFTGRMKAERMLEDAPIGARLVNGSLRLQFPGVHMMYTLKPSGWEKESELRADAVAGDITLSLSGRNLTLSRSGQSNTIPVEGSWTSPVLPTFINRQPPVSGRIAQNNALVLRFFNGKRMQLVTVDAQSLQQLVIRTVDALPQSELAVASRPGDPFESIAVVIQGWLCLYDGYDVHKEPQRIRLATSLRENFWRLLFDRVHHRIYALDRHLRLAIVMLEKDAARTEYRDLAANRALTEEEFERKSYTYSGAEPATMGLSPAGDGRLAATKDVSILVNESGEVLARLPFAAEQPATVADLDGDGAAEVVLAGRHEMLAFSPAGTRLAWRQELSHSAPGLAFGSFTGGDRLEFVNGPRASGKTWVVPVFDAATGGKVAELPGAEGLVRILDDYRLLASDKEWQIERSKQWTAAFPSGPQPDLKVSEGRLIAWTDRLLRVYSASGAPEFELQGERLRSPQMLKDGRIFLLQKDSGEVYDRSTRAVARMPMGEDAAVARIIGGRLLVWSDGGPLVRIRTMTEVLFEDRFAPIIDESLLVVDTRRGGVRPLDGETLSLDLGKKPALDYAGQRGASVLFVNEAGDATLWSPKQNSVQKFTGVGRGPIRDWKADGDRLILVRPSEVRMGSTILSIQPDETRWVGNRLLVVSQGRIVLMDVSSGAAVPVWQGGSATDY
jgi:hypothetical protein